MLVASWLRGVRDVVAPGYTLRLTAFRTWQVG